jgi:hypothetical protein
MITQEQIQSIVDGECSHEVRAALLRQLGTEPSAWRTLALSLLEEQEWARQLTAMAKCEAASGQNASPTNVREATQSSSQVEAASVQHLVTLADQSSGKWKSLGSPWLSVLAASLLLGLGFYGGSFLPRFSGVGSDAGAGDSVAASENPVRVKGQGLSVDDPSDTNMRMLVSGPNRETAEIPIYDLNAIDHEVFAAKQAYEVARLNQRLRKEGFELDVRPEYYTGQLHDGRKLIVPVKHVGLKPFGL